MVDKAQEYITIAEAADMLIILGHMVTGGIEDAANAHLAVAMDWLHKIPHGRVAPLLGFGGFDALRVEKEHLDCVKGYARIESLLISAWRSGAWGRVRRRKSEAMVNTGQVDIDMQEEVNARGGEKYVVFKLVHKAVVAFG